ncbi:MlaD family protein [Litorivivens sp.]|uniref:PqiB family protein n=1 Tax=Litorivivens sp. TaxID=2020868 RepID=UPI003568A5B9
MNETNLPSATEKPKKGISAIWLLPLIAVALSGWLMYKNLIEHGLEVTVSFNNGSGITVGKTPVVYQGINVGEVTNLQLDDDLKGVTVTLELSRQIEPLIREKTQFWLVQPQISLSGVSGLDTLVEGNYISFKPGDGKPASNFEALLGPPPLARTMPGLRLRLEADSLGSLAVGAPLLYQQIDVGDIEGFQLTDHGVEIVARVDPVYSHLINRSSRFWRQSGIKVNAGLQGVEVDVGSFASILVGGVVIDTPDKNAEPIEDDATFTLFATKEKAAGSRVITVYFQNPDGLDSGSKVRLNSMDVGRVLNWHFVDNFPAKGAEVRLEIKAPYNTYLNADTQFWIVKPEVSTEGIRGIDALIGGPYVAMKVAGEGGSPQKRYTGLAKPPEQKIQDPGLRVTLRSEEPGSISVGSKVFYRKIVVGQVEHVELDPRGVNIGVFIHQRYAHLLQRHSLFWNASGISISGNLGGFDIATESLSTIVAGGIAFRTPEIANPQAAWEGLKYTLHTNYESTLVDDSLDISLHFNSGSGLNKGTELKYQGIKVGEVYAVELDENLHGVNVKARLSPSAKGLARSGSEFWLVKPQLGLVGTRNLETLVTGSYIIVRPGEGKPKRHFVALDSQPALRKPETGLNLILTASQRGSIKAGNKVFYRDIPVGEVFDFELAPDSTKTLIHINIHPRYTALIRRGTRFWNASGVAVNVGLFSGANIRSKSIESLLEGGIAFATPEEAVKEPIVPAGTVFRLNDSVESRWLEWAPKIALPQAAR